VPLTNPYFQHFGSTNEQRLVEDLVVETISMYGMVIYYIPRKRVKIDQILGEDTMSAFEVTYPIEMYFDSAQGWEGDKSLLTKFGLSMPKQANFVVSRRRFNEVIKRVGPHHIPPENIDDQEVRPLEGDLIYIPMTKDLWEIRYVDYEAVFYQLGKNYIWRMTVEKFVYSNEPITTGETEIDAIAIKHQNNDSTANLPFAKNDEIQAAKPDVVDIDPDDQNPFGIP
jgi:hypothetical protein